MTLENNVTIRKVADDALELVLQLGRESLPDGDSIRTYLERVHASLCETLGIKTQPAVAERAVLKPMNDAEAMAFEREEMPWGMHEGKLIRDVPLDYLDYIIGLSDFKKKITQYLSNETIERKLQEWMERDTNQS